MASVITLAFEGWKAQEAATGKPVLLNEFVFANVPNLDPTKPIDRNEKLPPANQIVHRQAVNKAGLVSENAVAYSVTLGADVGDFDFNWIGLLNKESGTVAMITHAPLQKKLKTQSGQQGNVLIRSFLLEFNGAAEETQIKTSAETWQIDFTARLTGMDEMQRLINVDNYGAAAFFNDGFEVTRSGEQFTVKKGLGYVGGLRGQLEQNQILNGLRNTKIYADFSYQGNIVSQWNTVIKITSAATLSNYVDAAGFTHQVFAIASIDASGNVKDLRPMGGLSSQEIAALETRFKLDLSKKIDKANITHQMGNSTELVVSQQLLATELGKKQPAGNYAPAGDYVTTGNLNNELTKKRDVNDFSFKGAVNLLNPSKDDFLKFGGDGAGYALKVAIANNNTNGRFYFHDRVGKKTIYLPIHEKSGTIAL
ncbi:phage tail protein, partial [Providencia rettgeri]